jgi:hypothetical protein
VATRSAGSAQPRLTTNQKRASNAGLVRAARFGNSAMRKTMGASRWGLRYALKADREET